MRKQIDLDCGCTINDGEAYGVFFFEVLSEDGSKEELKKTCCEDCEHEMYDDIFTLSMRKKKFIRLKGFYEM